MKVATPAQAAWLNASGEYGPYQAANGHTMIAQLRFPARAYYQVGDRIDYVQHSAWCAVGCAACRGGDTLPDW